MASLMQLNLLKVAMNRDDNIDFSASRRKSMRMFSQRKSKFESRSDVTKKEEEVKTRKRIASSLSPKSEINQVNQNSMGKDIENQNVLMSNNKTQERPERFSVRVSPRDQNYIHKDNVLKEVSEADEDEKHVNTPQNKRPESESNSRLKDEIEVSDSKRKKTMRENQDIDIRIEDNW